MILLDGHNYSKRGEPHVSVAIGTGSDEVAAGDHNHDYDYDPLGAALEAYNDAIDYFDSIFNYHTHDAGDIVSGTLDGDRLPAMSSSKRGGVPATGAPSGLFLKDNGTWAAAGVADHTALSNLAWSASGHTGTANHVAIFGADGAASSEAQLAVSRGGTGVATATANYVFAGPTSGAAAAPAFRALVAADVAGLVVGVADGTVGAPGLSFASDPDNGLYRIGANNWGLAAGGTLIADLTTTAFRLQQYLSQTLSVNQSATPGASIALTASTLQDGSANTGTDTTMATAYYAVAFVASAAHTMGSFSLRIKSSATLTNPTAALTGYIYADDGGSPSK